MCNDTGVNFVKKVLIPSEIENKRVLESGARDVNGSVRPLIQTYHPSEYVGTDLVPGNGVDKVCDSIHLTQIFGRASFDVLVSTEVLEHVLDWRQVISNYKRVVKPGGIILLTTRSRGFKYHAYPDDYWRYEISDMLEIFSDCEVLELEKDTESPGVFVKIRIPENFVEKNLENFSLYSINFERIGELKMIGNAFHSYITGVPGWETDKEQETLSKLAKEVKQGGLILEIGGEYGMSASIFCHSAWPDVKIITVDMFPDDYQGLGSLLEVHQNNLKEAGYYQRSMQIKGDSKEIGKNRLKTRPWRQGIDLLFIDGDHSYAGALADIVTWCKSVVPGGIMVLHDVVTPENTLPHALHYEVTKAITEWFATEQKNWAEVGYSGTLQIFKKNVLKTE